MKKTSAKHFSGNVEGINTKRLITSSLFGSILGIAIFFLMLLAFSAICMLLPDPHGCILLLSFFSIYSSAFFAGLIAVKRNGSSSALICGSLCGTLFMLGVWGLLSLIGILSHTTDTQTMPLILKIIILPVAILGSFAGISSGAKIPKRKF